MWKQSRNEHLLIDITVSITDMFLACVYKTIGYVGLWQANTAWTVTTRRSHHQHNQQRRSHCTCWDDGNQYPEGRGTSQHWCYSSASFFFLFFLISSWLVFSHTSGFSHAQGVLAPSSFLNTKCLFYKGLKRSDWNCQCYFVLGCCFVSDWSQF